MKYREGRGKDVRIALLHGPGARAWALLVLVPGRAQSQAWASSPEPGPRPAYLRAGYKGEGHAAGSEKGM